jgi:hypothetical protein
VLGSFSVCCKALYNKKQLVDVMLMSLKITNTVVVTYLLHGTTALTGTSLILVYFEEQVANLLPQHCFESA